MNGGAHPTWEFVAVCCAVTVVCSILARREWRWAPLASAD
jgi:hypothetical protein